MTQEIYDGDKKQVFVSYHFTTMDAKFNGFGNYIGEFNMEIYKGNLAKFIQDLEKSIAMSLEQNIGKKVAIKVLYFR
ncbi:hypothetical protein LCGC14_1509150 [marine sediment metagenome]|uniref:Uncharacterized protein n=1 Tax=marine sediment metagenome TaxID=412755 RepID=A0A0F9JMN1_9ZZZZ